MKRYYVTDYYGNFLNVSTHETDLSQKVKCYDNDTDEFIYVNTRIVTGKHLNNCRNNQ